MKILISLFRLVFFFSSVTMSAQVDALNMRLYEYYLDSHSTRPTITGRAEPEARATVSLQQLEHKVLKEAQKQQKARDAIKKGDNQLAQIRLRNAIEIDPEFADAYNDLGVVVGWLGDVDEATKQFRRAIELVPNHHKAVRNLSIALYILGRCHEAIPVARRTSGVKDRSRL